MPRHNKKAYVWPEVSKLVPNDNSSYEAAAESEISLISHEKFVFYYLAHNSSAQIFLGNKMNKTHIAVDFKRLINNYGAEVCRYVTHSMPFRTICEVLKGMLEPLDQKSRRNKPSNFNGLAKSSIINARFASQTKQK